MANVEELLTAAREFDEQNPGPDQLEIFLEQACLVNDTDAWEVDDDRVTLMTMHAAKGLEFPVVFVIAVEEGLLPHERSRESPEQLEEERRLLFVAITRAKEELQLNLARYREFRGQRRYAIPSQFLMELPLHELETSELLWSEPAWSGSESSEGEGDASFDVDQFQSIPAEPSPTPRTPLRLTTAAALAAGESTTSGSPALAGAALSSAATINPDDFQDGMIVQHPDYGLGRITAISGKGPKRTATVAFVTGAGEKNFRLIHSSLTPTKSN